MSISEKIKTIDKKIEQNKAQYNFDRQTAKSSALSSGSVTKYGFLTAKDVLSRKELLEKAAVISKFEYSPLDKELKKQTSVDEKQCQKFNIVFESNKKEEDKTKNKRSCAKSNLVYNSYFTFYKYHNINEFVKYSLSSKLNDLKELRII